MKSINNTFSIFSIFYKNYMGDKFIVINRDYTASIGRQFIVMIESSPRFFIDITSPMQ